MKTKTFCPSNDIFTPGTFVIQNTSTWLGKDRFRLKEVTMTKVVKKTHPGTIVAAIAVVAIAALILIFFVF
jgi:hypothetical protein